MITLTRAAGQTEPRVPSFSGSSNDIKPTNVPNAAEFYEIDTGKSYRYDAENNQWYEGVGL